MTDMINVQINDIPINEGSDSYIYKYDDTSNCRSYIIKKFKNNSAYNFEKCAIERLDLTNDHVGLVKYIGYADNKVMYEYYKSDLINFTTNHLYMAGWIKYEFKSLVEGVKWCHDHDIYHSDIKLDNIFVDYESHLHLGDFSMSTTYKISHIAKGSMSYVSPEVYEVSENGGTYDSQKNDIWSLGMVLYALNYKSLPWEYAHDCDNGYNVYKTQKHFGYNCRDLILKSLICGMLEIDIDKRFTLQQILEHEWLN
jgi:serine/threonine protein kinase